MKTIITFILISNFSFAQINTDYEILLLFDSSKKEMIKTTYDLNENQSFDFILSKNEEKTYNYFLLIDQKGQLIKSLKGATSSACCSLNLFYNPKKNKPKKKKKI